MNKGKFVLGTLAGAAAGVVAGMLTAPQSGKETRADLKAKAAELKEEAARRAAAARTKTGDAVDAMKDEARHMGGSGESAAEEVNKDPSDKT